MPDDPDSLADRRDQLLVLTTKADLARLLNVRVTHLNALLWGGDLREQYNFFSIKKKSGGSRTIASPRRPLRDYQSVVAKHLQATYTTRYGVHGYVYGRSILTNAQEHVGRSHLLNLDLLNFFPSIHFGRVRGLFLAPPFSFSRDLATTLAQLCCVDGALPIGAPTSPVISNLICFRLDSHLQQLVGRVGARYTRYADDISISTMRRKLPLIIADISREGTVQLAPQLHEVIEANGFLVNESKTRLRRRWHRQEVTGIVVNTRPNVKRAYIRNIRAMLFNWQRDGYAACQADMEFKYHKDRYPNASPEFGEVLAGRLSFVRHVRGADDPLYRRLAGSYETVAQSDPDTPAWLRKRHHQPDEPSPLTVSEPSRVTERRATRRIFISYSHHDAGWLDELKVRLDPVMRGGTLDLWDDTRIRAGDDFTREIEQAILTSSAVILIVSAYFFSSAFITEHELPAILDRAESDGVRVLSLIVGESRWLRDSRLNRFQALNAPQEPLEGLTNAQISKRLQAAADEVEELLI